MSKIVKKKQILSYKIEKYIKLMFKATMKERSDREVNNQINHNKRLDS